MVLFNSCGYYTVKCDKQHKHRVQKESLIRDRKYRLTTLTH